MSFKSFLDNLNETNKLRRMNYISDQQGIMNRYIREKENWDKHLQESKNFILKSAKTKNKGKVVVLGSGWLLDLPLHELSELFAEVYLIDIHHPKQVIRKIKSFSNVKIVKADITGGMVDHFYHVAKTNRNKKEKLILQPTDSFLFQLPDDPDFVISLNIMCQLHIILVDYLKTLNLYSNQELRELDKLIQQSHLNMLPKNKTCLITDIEEEILDEENQIIGINPLIHIDLPEGNFTKTWQWKFDSLMTYRDDAKTYFNTQAIDF